MDEPAKPGVNAAGQTPMQEAMARVKAMGPGVALLAIASATLPMIGGFFAVGFATTLKPWVEKFGPNGWLMYAPIFALLTGCALMPTYALSFAAGVFFGLQKGAISAVTGVIVGAAVGYVWGYFVARERVMKQIDSDPRAKAVHGALVNRGFAAETGVVTLLRFPPNSPFAITNLVMSATGVNFGSYLIGTAVGMTPRTVLAAWLGAQAGDISGAAASQPSFWKWVGLGVTAVVVIVVYQLFSRWARSALRRLAGR
ncbi:MAG TPA: VTT domain-containing protein [Phycisphaerales bacterium]|nr:VTT domain-containing protein [Phycisphaerales bacterium]